MSQNEWDPLKDLEGVQRRMNQLFENALARTNFDAEGGIGGWSPVADAFETPDAMVLHVELPGIEQTDLDVRVDRDELVVQGERRMDREPAGEFHRVERSYGNFVRRFALPPGTDRESVEAVYRDGVLRITLSKRGADGGSIKIAVR